MFKHQEEAEQLIDNLSENATPLDMLYHLLRMKLVTSFLIKMRDLMLLSKRYGTIEPYLLSVLHQHQLIFQELLSQMFGQDYSAKISAAVGGSVSDGASLPILDGSVPLSHPGDEAANADSMTLDQYWDELFEHLRNGFAVENER